MKADRQKEHDWLQRLEGDWTMEAADTGNEDSPGEWKETGRLVGSVWAVLEGGGTMPDGSPGASVMTIGFDPARKKYVGTWVGSMMTHLWVYEGELDESGDVLTLNTEGPDFEGTGGMTKYKDIVAFEGDDRRILRSEVLGKDGKWTQMMSATYKRKN